MDKFFFVHLTFSTDKLVSILKDGEIKSGNQIPVNKRRLTGDNDPSPYVYTIMINKDNLNTIDTDFNDSGYIISPDIIKHKKTIFNKLWQAGLVKDSIVINRKDTNEDKHVKIKQINQIIKKPGKLLSIWYMNNEALFMKNILLKYIIGVVAPKKDHNKLSKYLPTNIKLYDNYTKALSDLIN